MAVMGYRLRLSIGLEQPERAESGIVYDSCGGLSLFPARRRNRAVQPGLADHRDQPAGLYRSVVDCRTPVEADWVHFGPSVLAQKEGTQDGSEHDRTHHMSLIRQHLKTGMRDDSANGFRSVLHPLGAGAPR